ncbi:DnaD domain protein [Streptococcus thoraltensis]|uniref:DnaD domain protein n=1 Tax=Streptococcus thoraltensis TaxID=55085 RepID=UPI001F5612AA|nr:DnaD domain protein [Streptococcus thoraltensis]
MRPIDEFSFVKGNAVDASSQALMTCYYPIIGQEAFSLYHYLVAFKDDGTKKHKFSEILNHTLMGMTAFETALATLTAMDLVAFYQQRDTYLIKLKAPLSSEDFLKVSLYQQLLSQKIGETAVDELRVILPENVRNLSKNFSDVFDDQGQVALVQEAGRSKESFDLDAFKNLMKRDGLSFAQEKSDIIGLYRIAENHKMTWFDTYLLAKETAVNLTISLSRMRAKKEQSKVAPVKTGELTPQEAVIVKEAQLDRADVFLAKIKKTRKAAITYDERQLLLDLAKMGFLDEVINVIVLYTIMKTNSANVNKKYAMKIANDFAYQEINKAETAILKMRDFSNKSVKSTQTSSNKQTKPNIPEWSNQDYQNQTSDEEQRRLEEARRKALERLRKD